MTNTEKIADDISGIFCRYKEKQKFDLLVLLNDARCCNCNHKSRIKAVHNQMLWHKKMNRYYRIVSGMLSFLIIFGTYILWLTSYYNEDRNCGGGSCKTSFLWPFSRCPVAF